MYRITHEYSCIVYQNKLYHIFVTPISAYSVISKESNLMSQSLMKTYIVLYHIYIIFLTS